MKPLALFYAALLALCLSGPAAAAESALPPGVVPWHSASRPNDALRDAIRRHYAIPESDLASTRYAYAYLDCDGDGTNELLAVVRGPYTSGTGGDSALLLAITPDGLRVKQDFTLVRTPLLAAYRPLPGFPSDQRPLLFRRSGGGAPAETVVLTSRDGRYVRVPDAPAAGSLSSVRGLLLFEGGPDFSLAESAPPDAR